MTNYCDRCSRQCGDAYACKECTKSAIANLRHIADLASALDDKRAKRRSSWDVSNLGCSKPPLRWRTDTNERTTFAASPSFASSPALHFDPRVSRVGHRVKNALVGIARDILDGPADNQPVGPRCNYCNHRTCQAIRRCTPPPDDAASIARWLNPWVYWLRLQPEAGETFDQLDRILGDLLALFDNPPPALFLGECKAEFEDGECTESLYLDRDKITSDTIACPHCGIEHDVTERRQVLMDGVNDYLGTAKEISHLLRNIGGRDVSVKMIYSYASHGMLTAYGRRREYDKTGRPRDVTLYNIGQVREAVETMQARRQTRREERAASPGNEQHVG